MNSATKFKAAAAVILGLAIAGCGGGGGDDDDSPASNETPSNPQSGAVSSGSAEYLNQTYQTGQSQVQQSQTAAEKTTNPAVRELAQQVNIEVTTINQQITNVSQTNKVTINNTLSNEQQVEINNLNTLSGDEFDRAYLRNLVSSMKRLLATTLRQAREGSDVQIRQTAAANLLALQQRLAVAQETWFQLQPPQYLAGAYEDSLLEIELGRIAVEKATNEQVRQFAQQMIDEHTQLNTRITALAQQKEVVLPTELGEEKQEIIATVSAFSGADFDRAYMDRNVLQHAEDIGKTSVVAEQSSDAEIQALAEQTLPLLQEHFRQAVTIASGIQPSAVYQLGQSLIAELQLAQLARIRGTDDQVEGLGETIVRQNQNTFGQIVQLAKQENAQIPLVISPVQVQAALPFLQSTGLDVAAIRTLIETQISQSLQIAQALQTNRQTGVSTIARTRIEILQNLDEAGTQPAAGNGDETPGTNGDGTTGGETNGDDADGSEAAGAEAAVGQST